jgi:DNA-binding beta-propeller fold protein YncE
MHLVSERRDHRLVAVGSALIALALVAVFAFAARAQAGELIYWNNYRAEPQTISVADMSGSGGLLNLTGIDLKDPEGMAIDSVAGRLYVASSSGGADEKGEIQFVNLDGSGAGVFGATGALVDEPYGVVVDPATRTIYWVNAGFGPENKGSIAWARLDGSAGGLLNTAGATVDDPYKIGLDPVNGRVYWGNYIKENETIISYANVNNSGGGNLSITPTPESAYAFAVDPAANRLYWSEGDDDRFAYTGLLGGSRNILDTTGAVVNISYGFAIDPTLNKIYWPNYGNYEDPLNGLGFASLSGGGGGNISPTAPFDGAQDVLVLKSPTGTGSPAISRKPKAPAEMTCSQGGWAADFAGSFVYQAPRSFVYQWSLNGAVLGSGPERITATAPGSYTCTVTATNQAGSASQTSSAAATVNAASVKLTVKPKKAKAKAGKAAKFMVNALNQGDIQTSSNAKVCVKVPKKAKKALKAPKCKKLGVIGGLTKKTTKVKVKVKPTAAKGSYKVTLQVKGSAGKAVKATVKVLG